jgi:hypothetical protein
MTEHQESLFLALAASLASTAWMQLGKVPHPLTGKVQRSLEHAQMTIDMLRMLKEKTKGNLTADEERTLLAAIADLELNYTDELKKGDAPPSGEGGNVPGSSESGTNTAGG